MNSTSERPARFKRESRLNAICPYFTMFPLDFPLRVLGEARSGEWVLDPFCGRGTTLFAARTLGLGSVGIDTNPVACALAEAKLRTVGPRALVQRCKEILTRGQAEPDIPEGEFWELSFHQETLRQLCRLREALRTGSDGVSVVLRALLLGILHGPRLKGAPAYLSNQMPRTYSTKPEAAVRYWRQWGLRPPRVDVLNAVRRRAQYVLSRLPARAEGAVKQGDARRVLRSLRRRFGWVVTSPPYYGMRTYLPDQWLRAWFLGSPPTVEYGVPGGQIGTGTEGAFVNDLAEVWRAVARRCVPGTHLVVRFGALPSLSTDAAGLLIRSLRESGVGWRVERFDSAGVPGQASRQAHQFAKAGSYVEEVDLSAILAGAEESGGGGDV